MLRNSPHVMRWEFLMKILGALSKMVRFIRSDKNDSHRIEYRRFSDQSISTVKLNRNGFYSFSTEEKLFGNTLRKN